MGALGPDNAHASQQSEDEKEIGIENWSVSGSGDEVEVEVEAVNVKALEGKLESVS